MAKDDDDPFDEIVRHLDIDLPFPDPARDERAPKERAPKERAPKERAPAEPPEDDAFYRRVAPTHWHPKMGTLLAWIGVIGSPLVIMVASVARYILPRPMLLGVTLLFVASAVYLIAQLPERGPGEPYWPDDGAQL